MQEASPYVVFTPHFHTRMGLTVGLFVFIPVTHICLIALNSKYTVLYTHWSIGVQYGDSLEEDQLR